MGSPIPHLRRDGCLSMNNANGGRPSAGSIASDPMSVAVIHTDALRTGHQRIQD
jgi:hypothetical protein